jgi:hypothetical protein
MSKVAVLIATLFLAVSAVFAQLSFDRPKVEGLLPNPSKAPAARDVVVEAAIAMLKDMNIDLDGNKTKKEEGILVAKPVIFTKGTVTVSQLEHFSHCPAVEARNWTRGRYTLQMVIEPLDPSNAKINISAKIEGETQGMASSNWVECQSKGLLEDTIMRSVIDRLK